MDSANARNNESASLPISLATPIVCVVDDDVSVRESLRLLIDSAGWQAETFASAEEFLSRPRGPAPSCLILDLELPDINGLDLQSKIGEGNHPQIVFITGYGDIPSSVRAIKAGAIDFLTKPFSEGDLMRAIRAAITQDRENTRKRTELTELRQRLSLLTPREREVLPLVVSGLLNKQAASELGISEITVQIHRSKIMQKMEAESLAELVRMAGTLEIPMTHSRHGQMKASSLA